MGNYETDIVVIAAGPSGMCAAIQAAQDGAEVIVLEKSSAVGGTANMGMGPLGIGTKYQKQNMYEISVEKAFNMFMEYTHYNADARLVKKYFEQSSETIEWLEELGVEFEGAFRYFPKAEATWHIVKSDSGIGPRAASSMNKVLYDTLKDLDIPVLLETPAKKIIIEEGKVSGVLATDKDGNEVKIYCKAVIVCTGGAGANPEMINQETGYKFGVDLFNFAVPGITGDGLKMAWEAGADKLPVRIEQAAQPIGINDLPSSVANVVMQPNLLVNIQGKRFMNEEHMQNTTFLGNAISHQKGKIAYSIVDSSIVKRYVRNGVDIVSLVHPEADVSDFIDSVEMAKEKENSGLIIAETIEELSEKTGIDLDNLIETLDDYNDYCDSVDEEFFKPRKYMFPLKKGPYYCSKIAPGGYGTVGGIRINENCEACGSDFEPIPGLYAAGADACNIYEDSYMFLLPGNSMGYAINTGRIAGMSAAEYIEEA